MFHRCEDLVELVGRQSLKEAMCIQKLSRPGGGGCEAVPALVQCSTSGMDPEKNEKMEGKKIPKVTVMAVVVDSVYGICAQVMVQRASDFGVFFPSSAP